MMPRRPVEFTEIEFDSIGNETEKAFLLKIEGRNYWLPKSQIDRDSDGLGDHDSDDPGSVRVAVWWAMKEGLI